MNTFKESKAWLVVAGLASLLTGSVGAEEAASLAVPPTLQCLSTPAMRQTCPGDTSAGVALIRSTGTETCLLGKNWGYDDTGVWVSNGCGGEFVLGGRSLAAPGPGIPMPESPPAENETRETWGFLDPGKGFLVGKSDAGELSISAYALVRYMNQMGDDTFTDHLGQDQRVDLRNDIYSHRVLVFLKGWVADPKMTYQIGFWTVNTTDQNAIFGNIGYQFNKKFNLYAGIAGNPGSRSMLGSHPYWLGNDRVMADEFFRPFFTMGVWANGEILPGLYYDLMVGNTSSTLGVNASNIDRKLTTGGSLWWMPTTHEFGPRGAFGDFEYHEELATRFGISATNSPEERYTAPGTNPGNTVLKLADSLNVFGTGSLAPDVTVTNVNYRILAVDAGMKYKGFFLQAEFYQRWLDNFQADGVLPVSEIIDNGFYVQGSFYPIPRTLELYAATSQIYGDKDAGFSNSSEYLVGMNWYPFDTRNHRLNFQVIDVNGSPVSSTFGYYTGGQDGITVAAAFSIFF